MDWNWSFRAFRLFGTEVRIHWSLPVFFLYYVLRAARHGPSPLFLALFVVTPFVLLFGSVLLHEFGHIFAARRFGLHVGHTILTPIGGMVMVGQSRTPRGEFFVAAAGPTVNLALMVLGTALYLALGGPLSAGMLLPFVGDDAFLLGWSRGGLGLLVLRDFVEMNALLFWFNVLTVAYPMDGGRMLLATLWPRLGYHRAMRVAANVSRVLAVGLGITAVLTVSPMLGVIAFFLWMQATMMLRQLPLMVDPSLGSWSSPYDAGPRGRWSRFEQGRAGRKVGFGSPERRRAREGGLIERFELWRERRRVRRHMELLARAEAKGLNALSPADREFLRKRRQNLN
jgi:Zn-dependent protease